VYKVIKTCYSKSPSVSKLGSLDRLLALLALLKHSVPLQKAFVIPHRLSAEMFPKLTLGALLLSARAFAAQADAVSFAAST
jgi:hypothetical protein